MSIRIFARIPVTLAAATTNPLAVPIYTQSESNWCWDACYQMVFAYNKFQISQCEIAQQAPWQTYGKCCSKPSCCDEGATASEIKQGWTHWGYAYDYSSSYITYNSVCATIDANQVIEPWLSWTGGGAHVVLVIGYLTNTKQYVYVNDPGNSKTVLMLYTYLKQAYGQGTWDLTWNNIQSN